MHMLVLMGGMSFSHKFGDSLSFLEGGSTQQNAGLSCRRGLQLIMMQLKKVPSAGCFLEK